MKNTIFVLILLASCSPCDSEIRGICFNGSVSRENIETLLDSIQSNFSIDVIEPMRDRVTVDIVSSGRDITLGDNIEVIDHGCYRTTMMLGHEFLHWIADNVYNANYETNGNHAIPYWFSMWCEQNGKPESCIEDQLIPDIWPLCEHNEVRS